MKPCFDKKNGDLIGGVLLEDLQFIELQKCFLSGVLCNHFPWFFRFCFMGHLRIFLLDPLHCSGRNQLIGIYVLSSLVLDILSIVLLIKMD